MTRLRFYLARSLRLEQPLQALSAPQSELLAAVQGKRIALIGNARALADSQSGAQIDAADLVIRINRAPMPSPVSHGTRCDWLALATRLNAAERKRIGPKRILWMSPKRKRLDWQTATSPGFYLHPLHQYQNLKTLIGAAPTTGAMMIDLLAKSEMAALDLFGFDFFASLSLSGSRTAADVPHDFDAESRWVTQMKRADRRITLN